MRVCNFDLHEDPFNLTPDPRFIYTSPEQLELCARLFFGVHAREGILVLTGEAGIGKTMLLRQMSDELKASQCFVFSFFNPPPTSFREILSGCCQQIGEAIGPLVDTRSLTTLTNFLIEQLKKDVVTVAIIDEAQAIPHNVLLDLVRLATLGKDRRQLLQIVLAGLPELEAKLAATDLRSLQSDITTHCRLEPLKENEVGDFIHHRLRTAGWNNPDLFSADAISLIAQYSAGIPGRINVLCGNALQIANLNSSPCVTAQAVERAALGGLTGISGPVAKANQLPDNPSIPIADTLAGASVSVLKSPSIGRSGAMANAGMISASPERQNAENVEPTPTNFAGEGKTSTATRSRNAKSRVRLAAGLLVGAALGGTAVFFANAHTEPVKSILSVWDSLSQVTLDKLKHGQGDSSVFSANWPEPDEGVQAIAAKLSSGPNNNQTLPPTEVRESSSAEPPLGPAPHVLERSNPMPQKPPTPRTQDLSTAAESEAITDTVDAYVVTLDTSAAGKAAEIPATEQMTDESIDSSVSMTAPDVSEDSTDAETPATPPSLDTSGEDKSTPIPQVLNEDARGAVADMAVLEIPEESSSSTEPNVPEHLIAAIEEEAEGVGPFSGATGLDSESPPHDHLTIPDSQKPAELDAAGSATVPIPLPEAQNSFPSTTLEAGAEVSQKEIPTTAVTVAASETKNITTGADTGADNTVEENIDTGIVTTPDVKDSKDKEAVPRQEMQSAADTSEPWPPSTLPVTPLTVLAQEQNTTEDLQPTGQSPAAESLLKRGDELMSEGDLAGARLFFELAAKNGSARAFTAVAMTYDPVFYATAGVLGAPANPTKALEWYKKAISAGDNAAQLRLYKLRIWLEQAAARGDAEASRLLSESN